MVNSIRFHLDEHVDPDIARALRQYGIDVSTTVEAGLRTAADPDQLAFVQREGRVLVTHDADFLRLAAQGVNHPGIAYCHKACESSCLWRRAHRLDVLRQTQGGPGEHGGL